MSLLSVTVKKARYVGIQATQYNTYVTLKLQNVKSTTVTVKGPTPSWEQDFLFEINDINLGLLVEVWNKGVIWDRALGYHYLPLTTVAYEEQEVGGRWIELETQLIMRGGAVVGTAGPTTGHGLLLDCRFELPFDAEGTGGADLQRKLDMLNGTLDAERAEQARRQMQYMAHSGYSEDSDYTSDLNYPVGQHPNCSASQFRTAAHQMRTPQRSLEASRENSYEREEYHLHGDADPLYYNSQPRTRIESWAQYQPELQAQASIESAVSWRTAAEWQSGEDQRRPSLERQRSLYDDIGYGFESYTNATHIRDQSHISHQPSYEEYYETNSYPYQATYVGEDTRPWDRDRYSVYDDSFGLTPTEYENLVNKRRSSAVQLPQLPTKQNAASSRYSELNGTAPYRPGQRRIAASLPATPSSTPKRVRMLPSVPGSDSGSIRSGRGRKLPRPPYPAPAHASPILYKEIDNAVPDVSHGYDSCGYSHYFEDTPMDQYQDQNFNTYDDEGMQPFFDETPHATPPAAVHKSTWNESETISQFTYPQTKEDDYFNTSKTVPSTISSYLPQVPVRSKNNQYQDPTYQNYDLQFDMTQQYDEYNRQDQEYNQYLQDNHYLDQKPLNNQQSYIPEKVTLDQKTLQQHNQNLQYQDDKFFNDQYQQQQKLSQPYQSRQVQQQPPQQQKQPAQQLQTTVLTGAATLGSFMAGGAKKLGSFFGAAAAAVAPPTMTQPSLPPATTASVPFTTAIPTITSFPTSSSITAPVTSVPEVSPAVPVTSTTSAVMLPRIPSLRRQESILRPPVRRIRTLPEAPDDLSTPLEESALEDDFKTDYDELFDHDLDKSSLDRYPEDEPDKLTKETDDMDKCPKEIIAVLPKIVSPIKTNGSVKISSPDIYQNTAPPIPERKVSQTSFHQDEKISSPAALEDTLIDKTKVTFIEDRTTYHEVPETGDTYRGESFDEHQDDYQSTDERYPQSDNNYRDQEKYDDQEQFNESEGQYHDESEFEKEQKRKLERKQEFREELPKLTPKQRWHRAYNKIVMQLNCGDAVGVLGHHGLSCQRSAGRFSRHAALNDDIRRALVSIKVPAVLEPCGIFKDDGERPDGITLLPWQRGRPLVWDATCVDTLAACHVRASAACAGSAAATAESSKRRKYSSINDNYLFVPFAGCCPEARQLFKSLACRLIESSGDRKAGSYLGQRISLAIQRGNVASVLGTLPAGSDFGDYFM